MSALKISYINIRGQTGLQIEKQLQIEEFLKFRKTDILHLYKKHIDNEWYIQWM